MTNSKKLSRRRGVTGIETAIVMIAFVIVAAALAFVVLNMGFSTTQKAKTVTTQSLGASSSSLEIEADITAVGDVAHNAVNVTAIPIKIAGGGDSINLDPALSAIKYHSGTVNYDNIYAGQNCILTAATYSTLVDAMQAAVTKGCIDHNPVNGTTPTKTAAVVYWTVSRGTQNAILDPGEHAVIAIAFASADRPAALDSPHAEISVSTGSALSVDRTIPAITTKVLDLG